MLRVTLVSLVVLSLLLWFAFQAKVKKQELLSTGLFTAAAVYALILMASFFGFLAG